MFSRALINVHYQVPVHAYTHIVLKEQASPDLHCRFRFVISIANGVGIRSVVNRVFGPLRQQEKRKRRAMLAAMVPGVPSGIVGCRQSEVFPEEA